MYPELIPLNDLEKFYIQFFKDSGFDLKDQQLGGDGHQKALKFKKRFVPKKGTRLQKSYIIRDLHGEKLLRNRKL